MPIKVFDFFAGCGGTSAGLRAAGMDIVLGIDSDPDAAKTFKLNFVGTHFICKDIRSIKLSEVRPLVKASAGNPLLFSGCAPCQPFSKLNGVTKRLDERRGLLDEFARFVKAFRPHFVFCENVPGIQSCSSSKGPFARFRRLLRLSGYESCHAVIDSQDFGVPQHRRRLILIASRIGQVVMPDATHGPGKLHPRSTAWQWIADLPRLKAGQTDKNDSAHCAAKLSSINLARIRATPPEGSRLDWPDDLVLDCHQGDHNGHTDVYGRVRKNQPASAMTTRCISLSNGRFGHPVQHRALSVREAACLQTFPRDFAFTGSRTSMARQVGNAVPVLLAKQFGEYFSTLAAKREVY